MIPSYALKFAFNDTFQLMVRVIVQSPFGDSGDGCWSSRTRAGLSWLRHWSDPPSFDICLLVRVVLLVLTHPPVRDSVCARVNVSLSLSLSLSLSGVFACLVCCVDLAAAACRFMLRDSFQRRLYWSFHLVSSSGPTRLFGN